jgi:hypothetical protein
LNTFSGQGDINSLNYKPSVDVIGFSKSSKLGKKKDTLSGKITDVPLVITN